MAEELYQQLEAGKRDGAEDSVHLERFPEADESLVDADLEAAMEVMREVVNLGRNLREQHRLRVRQPLQGIRVAVNRSLEPAVRDALTSVVSEELNVRRVEWVSDPAELVSISAKANFKVLGRKLGKKMKVVAGAIGQLDGAQISALQSGETLIIEGEEIDASGVMIVQESTGDGAVQSNAGVTVELDTTITRELHLEGLARELVSKVQAARKDAGLEVEDRIRLSVRTESDDLQAAIEVHGELICAEVLALELGVFDVEHQSTQAGTETVEIGLTKA
jgi:isoleucyl-tRNA synthetase